MKFRQFFLRGAVVAAAMSLATIASAQATRTWVSGVGDDANPCSRTAPCKTFAGAISKTADGGEINIIDPGGFGAVTITKNITIDGVGAMASILASGTNGVVINAAGIKVTLRNLFINGAGGGLNGVRFLSGGQLTLENVVVFNFTGSPGRGVTTEVAGGTVAQVHINNCTIEKNAGVGVLFSSASAPSVKATIVNSYIRQNGGVASGVFVASGYTVDINGTQVSNNGAHGVENAGGTVQISDSMITFNAIDGVNNSAGGTSRVWGNDLLFNTGSQLNNVSGTLATFGNNRLIGTNTGTITPATLQ